MSEHSPVRLLPRPPHITRRKPHTDRLTATVLELNEDRTIETEPGRRAVEPHRTVPFEHDTCTDWHRRTVPMRTAGAGIVADLLPVAPGRGAVVLGHGSIVRLRSDITQRAGSDYTYGMIDPTTAAGAVGAAAAKGAISSSAKKSEKTHDALLEEMAGTAGFKAAAEHRANRIEAQEGALNWLLRPLFWLNERQKKYYADDFSDDMAEKMKRVESDNIVAPDPNIGVQALEGLSYSLDSPELKDMYLELLATASDLSHQSDAHPGFASIIRQLSAREAVHLPDVLKLESHGAMANVVLRNTEGGYRYLERHVPSLTDDQTGEMIVEPDMASMIDNWIRLGLVVANYQLWSPDGDTYEVMKARPEYLRWVERYEDDEDLQVRLEPGIIYPTDFGRRFNRAVLR